MLSRTTCEWAVRTTRDGEFVRQRDRSAFLTTSKVIGSRSAMLVLLGHGARLAISKVAESVETAAPRRAGRPWWRPCPR